MKKTSSELKRLAREHLAGKWGFVIGTNLLLFAIAFICILPFSMSIAFYPTSGQYYIFELARFVISLICILFSIGIFYIYMQISRGAYCSMRDFTFAFRNRPIRFIGAYFLLTILTNLPMLPFDILNAYVQQHYSIGLKALVILAGIVGYVFHIILMYRYFIVYYLLIEYPEKKVIDTFQYCASLMNGNKGRAFYLSLSFIGMILLSVLTFGIGLLWILPYIQQTKVQLYYAILEEQPVESNYDETGYTF